MRRPIMLGIVGDSAAGKSTLTGGLVNLLGADRVTHICTDDYHKYDRKERAQIGITALHPECNYLDIMEQHLERLHYGLPILKPVYDHSNGSLVRPEYIMPKEFIIVEGLLGFYTRVMRQFYDVKVYLNPPEELRRVWKIKRDTTKRGYTREQVLEELIKREPDSEAYIRPQREFADIIVTFYPPKGVDPEKIDGHLNTRLVLRPTIPHPDFSYLIDNRAENHGIRLELGRDMGKPVDILEIDGNVPEEEALRLEKTIWSHLPRGVPPLNLDRLGRYLDRNEIKHSHPLALTQLLLAYHLLRAYDENATIPFAPPVDALSRIRRQRELSLKEINMEIKRND
ncbi:phosphoribulokinase [Candidatus Methylacidiphilum infernorum]|uniref:Phosphoribulokinase n=2 Tax=Candidatus Methylacidiphilum infernorum TaxID=511746 RepID=B3DVG2_METI4|nr:phosphoribulokinase [Candidatus Methylacidiphilum infernorum]ACD83315.1 Phosphoribulokinase [Methylacidiphilum infernorum V4]ANC58191.1 phosphoribulokinase [Candidatus Methylacidiphilum infernorum]